MNFDASLASHGLVARPLGSWAMAKGRGRGVRPPKIEIFGFFQKGAKVCGVCFMVGFIHIEEVPMNFDAPLAC